MWSKLKNGRTVAEFWSAAVRCRRECRRRRKKIDRNRRTS